MSDNSLNEDFRYAAMYECQHCRNQMRIGTDTKIGRLEIDGGCSQGCDATRVTLSRIGEVTVLDE